jgi:hypothetical protein
MNTLMEKEDLNQAVVDLMNVSLLLATLDRWIEFSNDYLMKEIVKMLSLLLGKLNMINKGFIERVPQLLHIILTR